MLLGIYVHTKTYTGMFTAALSINAKNLETTIVSWVNGYIYLGTSDNGILFSTEKKWALQPWKDMWSESASHSVVSISAAPWTIQFMEFSRPEYWSGSRFPSPGDLSHPGKGPRSPALQADSLPAEPQGKPKGTLNVYHEVKESNLKKADIAWFQLNDTPEKAKPWRWEKYQWLPEAGVTGGMKRWNSGLFRAVKTFYCYEGYMSWYIFQTQECMTPGVSPNVKCGLGVIMCQCGFITGDKCAPG